MLIMTLLTISHLGNRFAFFNSHILRHKRIVLYRAITDQRFTLEVPQVQHRFPLCCTWGTSVHEERVDSFALTELPGLIPDLKSCGRPVGDLAAIVGW